MIYNAMKTIYHPADSRGHANYGWLDTFYTFSFADYYDPQRVHFGKLRVLNDDTVAAGKGFGTHPHDNMEIITIVREGILEHRDSMGNTGIIKPDEIQVMSAGTGITHSEYNHSRDEMLKLFQIWVYPNKRNVEPRYDQMRLNAADRKNKLQQVIAPYPGGDGLWIYQYAFFWLGSFEKGSSFSYPLNNQDKGVYVFVIEGMAKTDEIVLKRRDGLAIWEAGTIGFTAEEQLEILIMEVPMK